MTGYYKIAGIVIEVNSMYDTIHWLSTGYAVPPQKPEIVIDTTPEDIEVERVAAIRQAEIDGEPYANFSDGELEATAVHRKIAEEMIWKNVLLFHGSAIAVDGEVYLFTAKSGTGKSTHTRLWREKFGERAFMVNDDKPMLRVHESGVDVCGTPWNGKHRLGTNTELPLRAICVLCRDKENHIEQIPIQEALPRLWQQSYRPAESTDMGQMLKLIGDIAERIPLFRLGCNMDPEAADVAWEGMHNASVR
jgi:hypothetical protein